MSDSALSDMDLVDGRILLGVLASLKAGDFSVRMPLDLTGVAGKVADGFNELIAAKVAFITELARVSRVVGREGKLSHRASLGGWTGSWSTGIDSVNALIDDLVRPTLDIQRVVGAIAAGDLSKKVTAVAGGEMLELKNTINAMVDQLNGFISELTRVTREIGIEGKLGQDPAVSLEVGGVWKDLTDNVNVMARNLTGQVRNIAEVTTSVANGDLSKKISIDVFGEFLELKNTVNAMVDQLNAFASEVTRVAREVGVEGKLGGQAQSKEVSGVWKDLTDNVNQLAANLTNQVRAISEVASAVTDGDLTRQVRVEASGEVAGLKDKLNEMIRNLDETTRQNLEKDWLRTNRERFTTMLQGQRDLDTVSDMILSELAPLVSAQHGVFYSMGAGADGAPELAMQAGYGFEERKSLSTSFALGQGLVGQCAKEKKRILLTEVPADYVRINSGLGSAAPLNIIVLPVLFEGTVRAVVELASFSAFSTVHQALLDSVTEGIGLVMNNIEVHTLTETLLTQAQTQAEELRVQQEELRESNADLERQARLLSERNLEAEQKNQEIAASKLMVEEKAGQLAVSSKYKSEFIANMSHELRTPLNSLLILAEQLEDDPERNLSETQVEYAKVIGASGRELLGLLNGVLDLAKVESGTMIPELVDLPLVELRATLIRHFGHVAAKRGLGFSVDLARSCPATIHTDPQQLGQILKNLLANAFKFTERGQVQVRAELVESGWSPESRELVAAPAVLAINVADSGIGIEIGQQQSIFDAFTQGDGSTARRYGGTGLGLSISRELVALLGGEIALTSTPGVGSTFTVYLPATPRAAIDAFPIATTPMEVIPRQRASSPRHAPDPAPSPSMLAPVGDLFDTLENGAIAGKKILVVDDDYRNLFSITALLERGHANVTTAENGIDAIAALDRSPDIDMVLMDIMMPVMDGYTCMRTIRSDDRHRTLPIIAVTGKVVAGERERCVDAGANDYVPKPLDSAELLAIIGPWLTIDAGPDRPPE